MAKKKGVNFTNSLIKIQETITNLEEENEDLRQQLKYAKKQYEMLEQKYNESNGNETELSHLRLQNDKLTVQVNTLKRQNKDILNKKLEQIKKILME